MDAHNSQKQRQSHLYWNLINHNTEIQKASSWPSGGDVACSYRKLFVTVQNLITIFMNLLLNDCNLQVAVQVLAFVISALSLCWRTPSICTSVFVVIGDRASQHSPGSARKFFPFFSIWEPACLWVFMYCSSDNKLRTRLWYFPHI